MNIRLRKEEMVKVKSLVSQELCIRNMTKNCLYI